MNLNIHQLNYLLEIERAGSVSRAAANLFMAQSNLSRILKDTEENVGFKIFERTRRGLYPTERGRMFLLRAESIMKDIAFIDQLKDPASVSPTLHLCLPHSYSCMKLVSEYLNLKADRPESLISIEECNPATAIDRLESAGVDLAVIRFISKYHQHYQKTAESLGLVYHPLKETVFQVVLSEDHPLAASPAIERSDLSKSICISGKPRHTLTRCSQPRTRLCTTDRLAQYRLLQTMPDSFLWSEPLPQELLSQFHLVQRPCSSSFSTQSVLLYRSRDQLSETAIGLINWLTEKTKDGQQA